MDGREYLSVVADYLPDGTVIPVSIRFEDGPAFPVTRVINAVHMSSTKQNGAETRFSVVIGGKQRHLFFEDGVGRVKPRWFVLR